MASSLISEDMRNAVGRELARMMSYPVSASDIRKWALAVYYPQQPPERFWDEQAAADSQWGTIVAPEDFNPFAWLTAVPRGVRGQDGVQDPDRTERTLGIAGPGLKFELNGGVSVAYGAPIRPGDVITSVKRLAGYTEREGRLGLMLFTAYDTTWTNQRDEFVKRTCLTLIRY
jgi:N-terminal half of MaoC dehydratase